MIEPSSVANPSDVVEKERGSAGSKTFPLEGKNNIACGERLRVMQNSPYLSFLHGMIRDSSQTRSKFVFYTDQLLRLLCEFAFESVPHKPYVVMTPTGNKFQ
eukprot:1376719-Amorphochlora_amoeboformis.AAC.2